jgi:acyl-ACP thioesterase
LGFEGVHPLWIVRRTMIDLNKPIEFPDLLRLRRTTDVDRLKWKASLTPGNRENPTRIYDYPVRVTDNDLGDHMKNAVYWGVVEDHLSATPEVLNAPLRVTIEHEAPIALGYAG